MSHDPSSVNAVDRSELESLRLEMTAGFGRMEGKLDAYVQSHSNQHNNEQSAFTSHLVEAAVDAKDVKSLLSLPARVDALEDWRIEVRTLGTILRMTFGASVLSVVVTIVALCKTLGWL